MTNSSDYYDVLGCTKESSYEEIKKAYRTLALQYHPDKSTAETCILKFQRILEAWKVLSEPKSREEYDASRRQEELDSESVLVYARVTVKELNVEDEETFSYECRCGSRYCVQREDLPKDCSIHVPCQECTFVIVVDT